MPENVTPPGNQRPDITPEMLNTYGLMLTWLFVATIVVVLAIAIPVSIAYFMGKDLPILAFVALGGALGGFISSLSRLYALRELPALLLNRDFRLIQNRYVAMYSLIPPLVGIVGAVVVYVAIAGGLLQGDLFPKFTCYAKQSGCDSLGGLLQYGPETVRDHAKSLVWGFLSGFSERFFPGAIENLSKQGK